MKRGQKGFGAIEALLFLILLSILGFTGYYVYHTKNNTNSTYNNAASSSNSTAATTQATKFVFKELGVQVNLPYSLNDLTYSVNSTGGTTYLNLTTPEYNTALLKCDPSLTSGGTIVSIAKIPGQFNQDENPGTGNLHQFKDFWISGASPNGIICADTASEQDKSVWQALFHSDYEAIQTAFTTATLVQ